MSSLESGSDTPSGQRPLLPQRPLGPSRLAQFKSQKQAALQARLQQRAFHQDQFWLTLIILERFVTRLFSEKLGLLPDWTNFLDLPLLILFAGYVAFATRHRPQLKKGTGYGLLIVAFIFSFSLSSITNLSRLHPGAMGFFLLGFLEPLAYMALAYALAPRADIVQYLIKLLMLIGWLQILVVVIVDLPRFLATKNPDFISGTFGDNAYQLVFFLLAWNVVVLSQSRRTRHPFWRSVGVLGLQILILAIVFLAQFRAVIPFALITWTFTYLVVNPKPGKAAVGAGFGLGLFLVAFYVINVAFPELKYNALLQVASRSDEVEQSGKVQAIQNLGQLIRLEPQILVYGTGPGTYASRGFRTFSVVGRQDTVNVLYRRFFHTDFYITDVAARYVLPTVNLFAFGASTTASPWFSYLALPAEVGLPGLIVVLWFYFRAMRQTWHHRFAPNGVGVLAGWVFVGMALLLQMAFLENWLEVSRLTVPVWTIFGVVLSQIQRNYS